MPTSVSKNRRLNCESAHLRIAALKDPEELEEIEKSSDKLAADLRKETRARKAAEKELAKATADERAVEIEVFEKNAADLKDEIEGKTGELDSFARRVGFAKRDPR